MILPKKPKRTRTRKDEGDIPRHRAWVRRNHGCCVPGCQNTDIVCAHNRLGLPPDGRGGSGFKPHDKYTFSLCNEHHLQQGRGEATFADWLQKLSGKTPLEFSAAFWERSPIRREMERQELTR